MEPGGTGSGRSPEVCLAPACNGGIPCGISAQLLNARGMRTRTDTALNMDRHHRHLSGSGWKNSVDSGELPRKPTGMLGKETSLTGFWSGWAQVEPAEQEHPHVPRLFSWKMLERRKLGTMLPLSQTKLASEPAVCSGPLPPQPCSLLRVISSETPLSSTPKRTKPKAMPENSSCKHLTRQTPIWTSSKAKLVPSQIRFKQELRGNSPERCCVILKMLPPVPHKRSTPGLWEWKWLLSGEQRTGA